jgi:hypothetical protein
MMMPTDDELVARGRAVVPEWTEEQTEAEDTRYYTAWKRDPFTPSWHAWLAGKADLAGQVWDIMMSGAEDRFERLTELLLANGARHQAPEG